MFESRISAGATEKLPTRASGKLWCRNNIFLVLWHEENVSVFVQSRNAMHGWTMTFKEEEHESVGELSTASHKSYWNVCIWLEVGDLRFYGHVNKRARAVTKWTKSCDKCLNRLISYIHHTSQYKQYCSCGESLHKQCRLGLFQDSDFAGDLEDSKSTSGGILCILGSHTFVPRSWMCKKQTSVSHSSTEAEVISRDAGLRMDGIPALGSLGFGDWSITFLHQTRTNKTKDVRKPRCNLSATPQSNMRRPIPTTNTNIDQVPSSGTHSGSSATLYVFEDNEAVI